MSKKQKITIREFIHYLNCTEKDIDVYVDGIDGIAVCGGEIALTPAGMAEFGEVLEMEMDGHCIIGNDDDYDILTDYQEEDKGDGGRLQKAWEFLCSLAGYCSCDNYDKWFKGDDAELI